MDADVAVSGLTLLVFEVDGHRYALEVSALSELIRAALPARLAEAPSVVEGVLNVRGRIAAVLDMRARFALARRPIKASDVLIVCEVADRLLALRVDAIADLVHVPASSLASVRTALARAAYTAGLVKLDDGLLLIADVPAFLDAAEQAQLDAALARVEPPEASA